MPKTLILLQTLSTDENMSTNGSSERPQCQPYRECLQRQRPSTANDFKTDLLGGNKLWRQMMIGFICAAFLGVIMLILGSVFIGNAIRGNTSITVMLCVMGLVCGLIILVGTAILGRLFISRKWRVQEGRDPVNPPPEACFHTCSIIYTPSQDQLNGPPFTDPPPAYEMVVFPQHHRYSMDSNIAGSIEMNDGTGSAVQPIIMAPPKYSIAAAPLPAYGDPV